jgi:hypothetical protein
MTTSSFEHTKASQYLHDGNSGWTVRGSDHKDKVSAMRDRINEMYFTSAQMAWLGRVIADKLKAD